MILDQTLVVWSTDGIDVTTGIVDLFDKMNPPAANR